MLRHLIHVGPARFAIILVVALIALSCSNDGGDTGPGYVVVSMQGSLDFPSAAVNPEDVTVGFGDYEVTPDADGSFDIKGNQGLPGLAVASVEDTIPLLMAIVPDPGNSVDITMDAHSTALALAFLSPFVCVSQASGAEEVVGVLEGLPEMAELEAVLADELASDPLALTVASAAVDSALSRLVRTYVNSYPALVARHYPSSAELMDGLANAAADVIVSPSNTVSGHQVSYQGSSKFKITNARGRWAYCVTPQDSFFVFPNGTLLDALKGSLWAPSTREFTLNLVTDGDTLDINVFGAGFASEPDNLFMSLTSREQWYAMYAGGATVLFEFVPQIAGVITNSSNFVGRQDIAKKSMVKLTAFMRYPRIADRLLEYYRASDWWGMTWFLSKEAIAQIVNDDDFRDWFMGMVGIQLGEQALTRLACWVVAPAKVLLIGDSVTSVMKTTYGFVSTRFKTTFRVWQENLDFEVGNIQGSIHDKDSGLPIEGVTVNLAGDDANPLHPSHEDITGEDGGYYFSNILVGEKTLTASKTGYKSKSVTVEVEDGKTVSVEPMELEKEKGSMGGKIIDEILLENGAVDPTFKKECDLTYREIGGEHRTGSFYITSGTYRLHLDPGVYWFIASHDDYFPDSIQVIVQADENLNAPRDLLMKPKGTLEGDIYIDMANDGDYEIHYTFKATLMAASRIYVPEGTCPDDTQIGAVIDIVGMSAGTPFDAIEIYVDPARVKGAGFYGLGGILTVGCPAFSDSAGIALFTSRYQCSGDYGSGNLNFIYDSDPDFVPCRCGITNPGSFVVERFGSDLTDAIDGGVNGEVAGWKTCECSCCEDTDGDGQEDDWVVSCARAYVDIDFKVLVGSLYDHMVPGSLGAGTVAERVGRAPHP